MDWKRLGRQVQAHLEEHGPGIDAATDQLKGDLNTVMNLFHERHPDMWIRHIHATPSSIGRRTPDGKPEFGYLMEVGVDHIADVPKGEPGFVVSVSDYTAKTAQ